MIDRVKANSKIEIHWNTKVEKLMVLIGLKMLKPLIHKKVTSKLKLKDFFMLSDIHPIQNF